VSVYRHHLLAEAELFFRGLRARVEVQFTLL